MAYTTINKSTDYFNTKLYTGDGNSPRSITGVGFQPDFLWIKNRSGATGYEHRLMDAVRGSNKVLHSSNTGAETSEEYYTVSSFDSDGWTGRNGTGTNQVITGGNDNGYTFASWNWKANGTGSANTDGSISSTVSANTTSGFSIVKYTGNATSGATVGHGLGVTPKVIIIKGLGTTYNWIFGHNSLSTNWTNYLTLSTNDASAAATNIFNDTAPTSSVFSIGNALGVNTNSSDYIAYCFAEKQGYSKIGSYTGNGNANGTFVYTGFKPSFVIIKNSSNAHNWTMIDNKRLGYNDKNYILFPDLNNVEPTTSETDILSNGFKIRSSANGVNQSGNTIIYMAFGQSIVGSNNVPCTAR